MSRHRSKKSRDSKSNSSNTSAKKQRRERPIGLGLDLSLRATGLVVWDGRRVLRHGKLETEALPKGKGPGDAVLRVRRDKTKVFRGTNEQAIEWVRRKVSSTIRKFDIEVVCIEGHSFGSQRSMNASVVVELHGVIKNELHRAGAEVVVIQPLTLKKLATGYGRAEKSEMIRMAQDGWPGCPDGDDDQADAFHLAVEAQRLAEGF